jgi:peroxiredoxin
MKSIFLFLILIGKVNAEVLPGESAPDFKVKSSEEKIVTLSSYRKKYVVLEWFNKDCPFVRKHYDTLNMQTMQKKFTQKNVVWLTIISSAPGKQGYVNAAEANVVREKEKSFPTQIVLDSDGVVGHLYGAKTTPFMVLINPEGKVVYVGAVDDTPSFDRSDIPKSKNLFDQALTQSLEGKVVTTKYAKPYGCAVKY